MSGKIKIGKNQKGEPISFVNKNHRNRHNLFIGKKQSNNHIKGMLNCLTKDIQNGNGAIYISDNNLTLEKVKKIYKKYNQKQKLKIIDLKGEESNCKYDLFDFNTSNNFKERLAKMIVESNPKYHCEFEKFEVKRFLVDIIKFLNNKLSFEKAFFKNHDDLKEYKEKLTFKKIKNFVDDYFEIFNKMQGKIQNDKFKKEYIKTVKKKIENSNDDIDFGKIIEFQKELKELKEEDDKKAKERIEKLETTNPKLNKNLEKAKRLSSKTYGVILGWFLDIFYQEFSFLDKNQKFDFFSNFVSDNFFNAIQKLAPNLKLITDIYSLENAEEINDSLNKKLEEKMDFISNELESLKTFTFSLKKLLDDLLINEKINNIFSVQESKKEDVINLYDVYKNEEIIFINTNLKNDISNRMFADFIFDDLIITYNKIISNSKGNLTEHFFPIYIENSKEFLTMKKCKLKEKCTFLLEHSRILNWSLNLSMKISNDKYIIDQIGFDKNNLLLNDKMLSNICNFFIFKMNDCNNFFKRKLLKLFGIGEESLVLNDDKNFLQKTKEKLGIEDQLTFESMLKEIDTLEDNQCFWIKRDLSENKVKALINLDLDL